MSLNPSRILYILYILYILCYIPYILYIISYISSILYQLVCREGLLTHSFFPERDWSGVWLRLNARRLAVPRCPPKSRLFGGKKPGGLRQTVAKGLLSPRSRLFLKKKNRGLRQTVAKGLFSPTSA